MSEIRDLPALREAIEAIDRELLSQLRRRMDLAEEVAAAKLRTAYPFRDEPREDQILQRVRHAAVERGLDAHEIERLYRVILDMSVAHQKAHVRSLRRPPCGSPIRGSRGPTAISRPSGATPGTLRGCCEGFETFRGAAEAVRGGNSDRALLPIENTTAGSINEVYDLLAEGGLTITAEVVSRIEHCLLGLPGARVEDLRKVLSHPQGLLQCQDFLRSAPWMKPQVEFDTAGSARKVRERNDPAVAAIASEHAAKVFGLEVLRRGDPVAGGELHPLRGAGARSHPLPAGDAGQDLAPALPPPPAGRAGRGARRAQPPGGQPGEAGVAADPGEPLQIPLLSGSRWQRRPRSRARRAGGGGAADDGDEDAGDVSGGGERVKKERGRREPPPRGGNTQSKAA